MMDNIDGHIPSPLIIFTGTVLHHAPLEWQKNNGVHPTASKSRLTVDRTDRCNYIHS